MKFYLYIFVLTFLIHILKPVYSQNQTILFWNNSNSSKIIYPIAISNDSISDNFATKNIKYRNLIPVKSRNIIIVILNNEKINLIIEFLNLKYDIFQETKNLENPNLSYPEIRYIVNDSIQKKLVLSNTEIFVRIIDDMLDYTLSILSYQEHFEIKKAVYILYNSMGSKYYELEE